MYRSKLYNTILDLVIRKNRHSYGMSSEFQTRITDLVFNALNEKFEVSSNRSFPRMTSQDLRELYKTIRDIPMEFVEKDYPNVNVAFAITMTDQLTERLRFEKRKQKPNFAFTPTDLQKLISISASICERLNKQNLPRDEYIESFKKELSVVIPDTQDRDDIVAFMVRQILNVSDRV